MGLAFGFGWTPCVGPALATVLFIAADKNSYVSRCVCCFSHMAFL